MHVIDLIILNAGLTIIISTIIVCIFYSMTEYDYHLREWQLVNDYHGQLIHLSERFLLQLDNVDSSSWEQDCFLTFDQLNTFLMVHYWSLMHANIYKNDCFPGELLNDTSVLMREWIEVKHLFPVKQMNAGHRCSLYEFYHFGDENFSKKVPSALDHLETKANSYLKRKSELKKLIESVEIWSKMEWAKIKCARRWIRD